MKQALLIIDVQNDYFPNGNFPLDNSNHALSNIKTLLQCFREQGNPVFFIQHISNPPATFFLPETSGVEIHSDITPLPSEATIIKQYPNSFFATTLQQELQKEDITDLTICGMMTHMCVDTTVRAAIEYGYHNVLIGDACATRELIWDNRKILASIVQNVYMASLNNKFASVYKTEEYINMTR